VPVITAGEVSGTVELCRALAAGGLDMLEITLRTPTALAALEAAGGQRAAELDGAGNLARGDDRDGDRGPQPRAQPVAHSVRPPSMTWMVPVV
ncbi:MAG: hypothetical protein ACKOUS_17660, partial [Alphaproteobacteria bacterium]